MGRFLRVVYPGGCAEPSVDDVTVQLQVLPIAEPEIVDPVEQFLLLLEEQVLVKGLVDVIVHGERLVEDHVLDGAVLDDLFFAARDAVLIDFEDELGLFGLREEADADDVRVSSWWMVRSTIIDRGRATAPRDGQRLGPSEPSISMSTRRAS